MAELRSKYIFVFAVLLLLNSNGFRISSSTRVNDSNLQYFLFQTPEYPRDCHEVLNKCSPTNAKSGVYLIKPDQYQEPFQTYCDHNTTSGGWTVIQRRVGGSISFNRTWDEYKNGIGFLGSEFLIGNEKLSHLINQNRYQLRIELENYAGQSYSLTYDNFRIADEWGNYSITSLGGVEGITDLPITWCSSNKDNFDNTCERTCENPNDCVIPDPAAIERCLCPENHMVLGDRCIPQEQCACYVQGEGFVLAEGEFYINSRCTRRSTCSNNQIIEASYQCSDHATCDERSGVRKCYCNQNYQGDGMTCTHNCFVAAKGSVLREGEFYINSRCTRRSTCRNNQIIEASYQCSDHATCDERSGVRKCYCNLNYQGDGMKCTHNCFVAAKRSVLMEGEFYINSRCTRRSTCSNNQIIEASYQCSDHATCDERSGVRKCYCTQNYQGDGVTCTHNCFVAAKGSVLREGESYNNSDCSLRITCNNNVLTSERYSCSADATCEERNDIRRCYCNEWFEGDGVTCTRSGPRDCSDLHTAGRRNNGKYTIYPAGSSGFEVFCEMSSGGWTILQQRTSRSVSFYRNWNEYKNGFGIPTGDHWIGNDKIYKLTNQKTYQLLIEKTNTEGSTYHSRYSSFSIRNERDKYRLSLGDYDGNAGNNAMGANTGFRFSTHDQDNDGSSTFDCAEKHRGGWWYPNHSNTGSTSNCYSFSNRVRTSYEYSDCGCFSGCSSCPSSRPHQKCYNCDGCTSSSYCISLYAGYYQRRCCANKNPAYETNFYSCGYSNLNGDYSFNDYRGIFWKNLHGSDCGITTTTMKIQPSQ